MIASRIQSLKDLLRFWRMTRKSELLAEDRIFRVSEYGRWRASLRNGRTALLDAEPWLTFGARDHLKNCLTRSSRVFEWGSGGSTLFLLRHAGEVVTIEHDRLWFARVMESVAGADRKHWKPFLVEPEVDSAVSVNPLTAGDWTTYTSGDALYSNHRFTGYAQIIDQYPDHYFDVVIVDGRSRPACVVHGFSKLRPGGTLILDNSEVSYYDASIEFLKSRGCVETQYSGAGPYNRHFWRTTVFQRPACEERLSGAA